MRRGRWWKKTNQRRWRPTAIHQSNALSRADKDEQDLLQVQRNAHIILFQKEKLIIIHLCLKTDMTFRKWMKQRTCRTNWCSIRRPSTNNHYFTKVHTRGSCLRSQKSEIAQTEFTPTMLTQATGEKIGTYVKVKKTMARRCSAEKEGNSTLENLKGKCRWSCLQGK